MIPSAAQIRAGRALVGLTRAELAAKADFNQKTVQQLEDGQVSPRAATLEALGRVLEAEGVLFLAPGAEGGEGVRRAPSRSKAPG